ncbi:MAG: efflux RND transporter periplasmic adaptor subunit [Gammaproteobacteria bacterium]|nr:efflux RND transporter periplasmic adaptor subunit [Gammaproteobacteria bacterium]
MSRRAGFLAAGAIVAGSVALAAFMVSLAPEPERREPPPQIPFAQTARVMPGDGAIPVHGAGTVRPSAEVDIIPQVSGKVVWINPGFQSGGRIEAGQTIFRIEEEDYLYRVREAEADLEARRVELLEAREKAEIARTEYEQFSGRRSNGASVARRANPLTLREPQLKAAEAALDREEARVAEAKLALSRTRVRAPFDGYVRDESVDLGEFVTAGQAVGRIFATDAVEVVVPLSDASAALIPGLWELRAGDAEPQVPARVSARYGDARYTWEGYVDRAETSLDKQTRTIDVIVRVANPFSRDVPAGRTGDAPPLLVGKFVEVAIRGLVPEAYYRVPRAALQPGDEVWVVRGTGSVHIVPVRVLQRANDQAYVAGALENGQRVVTGGIQFATEGMRVQAGADAAQ